MGGRWIANARFLIAWPGKSIEPKVQNCGLRCQSAPDYNKPGPRAATSPFGFKKIDNRPHDMLGRPSAQQAKTPTTLLKQAHRAPPAAARRSPEGRPVRPQYRLSGGDWER